mgnify:CR=1 FL=1
MNLQKKLDLIEQYGTCIRLLSYPSRSIDYTVPLVFGKDTTSVNIEVNHGRDERTKR